MVHFFVNRGQRSWVQFQFTDTSSRKIQSKQMQKRYNFIGMLYYCWENIFLSQYLFILVDLNGNVCYVTFSLGVFENQPLSHTNVSVVALALSKSYNTFISFDCTYLQTYIFKFDINNPK